MRPVDPHYVPAAGSDRLLPLYDPLTRLFGVESIHRLLIEQAAIQSGLRVLEIGCGTGNLALLANRLCPGAEITGVDPDPKALERARQKAQRSNAAVRFDQGFAQQLPYPDASFDRVLSSLMFHHLQPDAQQETLQQARRVLRPGGSLHLMDFTAAGAGLHGFFAHLFHSSHGPHGHAPDPLATLIRDAGFADAAHVADRATFMGRIAYYRAAVA